MKEVSPGYPPERITHLEKAIENADKFLQTIKVLKSRGKKNIIAEYTFSGESITPFDVNEEAELTITGYLLGAIRELKEDGFKEDVHEFLQSLVI